MYLKAITDHLMILLDLTSQNNNKKKAVTDVEDSTCKFILLTADMSICNPT